MKTNKWLNRHNVAKYKWLKKPSDIAIGSVHCIVQQNYILESLEIKID